MRALKESGYRIPEDIAIIGFDDIPICEYSQPALSTIEVPKFYMGETASARMIELIENKSSQPLKIEVAVKLKKRKSV